MSWFFQILFRLALRLYHWLRGTPPDEAVTVKIKPGTPETKR